MKIAYIKDEDGLVLTTRTSYRESEEKFIQKEMSIMYPKANVVFEEYIPRTKETAEAEINKKLNAK